MTSDFTKAKLCKLAYHTLNLVRIDDSNMGFPAGYTLSDVLYGQDKDGIRPFGLIVNDPDGAQIVSFRGTDTWSEWYTDAEIELVPNSTSSNGSGRVHKGFLELYESLVDRNGALGWQSRLKGKETAITGHSLGAALATFLALDLGSQNLTTFGSPKLGDKEWAQEAQKTLGGSKRYVSKFDPIPWVPLSTWHVTFEHVCVATQLNGPLNMISTPMDNHSIDRYAELLAK